VRRVFVDSSAFFALIAREDRHHKEAAALFASANRESWELVTTNATVFECHALLLNRSRPGYQNAIAFLDLIDGDEYRVERVKRRDEKRAVQLVRTQQDKTYSLCDALSFAVMERLGLTDAIAFDEDFRSYGRFTTLRAE